MFTATITSDTYPIEVKRMSDGSIFQACIVLSMGNTTWAPVDGDVVLCETDETDICYIFGRIQNPKDQPVSGTQIGNNIDGIRVGEDGKAIAFLSDVIKVLFTPKGIDIDTSALNFSSDGLDISIQDAGEMETKASVVFHSLLQGSDLKITLSGNPAGQITLSLETPMWKQTLDPNGKLSIDTFTEININNTLKLTPDGRVVMSNGTQPIALEPPLTAWLNQLLTNYNAHTHLDPSSGTTGTTSLPLSAPTGLASTAVTSL